MWGHDCILNLCAKEIARAFCKLQGHSVNCKGILSVARAFCKLQGHSVSCNGILSVAISFVLTQSSS